MTLPPSLTFAARTTYTMDTLRKPWVYKRCGIKGWWPRCGEIEAGNLGSVLLIGVVGLVP